MQIKRFKNKKRQKLVTDKRKLISEYFSKVTLVNPKNHQDLQDYFYFREGFEAGYKHATGKKLIEWD